MADLNFRELDRRAQRYWDIDGLPELVMGALWMLWGCAWLVGEALPAGTGRRLFWIFTPALLAFSGVAAIRVIKILKARLTFPRSGYVVWKEPGTSTRLTTAVVAVVTAAILVALLARANGREAANAPVVLSVILSLAFVVASLRQRAPHLLALAGVVVVLGFAFGALDRGWTSVNWMFVALGAVTSGVGGLRLAQFLRKHPRRATSEEA